MLAAVGDHGLLIDFRSRTAHDESSADLAETFVGNSDDRDVGHPFQSCQRLFDFGRVDIESAADIHIFESVGDLQVAGFVDRSDVTGMQPPFGINGRGGGLRIIEVAEHDIGSAQ